MRFHVISALKICIFTHVVVNVNFLVADAEGVQVKHGSNPLNLTLQISQSVVMVDIGKSAGRRIVREKWRFRTSFSQLKNARKLAKKENKIMAHVLYTSIWEGD